MRYVCWALLGIVLLGANCGSSQGASALPMLYVSPTGGRLSTCTASDPCNTFDRAYHLARPGQVVVMADGVYPAQSLSADPLKASASANVVFQPAPGATVTLANSTFTIAAGHVEFDHLRMDQTGCADAQPTPPCPQLVVATGAHDVVIDDMRSSRFFITGAYNVTISNSDFGPSYDTHGIIHADTAGNRPHDIVLSNDSVHDHWNTSACKASSSCFSSHHMGCGPTINDAYNVLEDRMSWFNCEDLDQLIKPYQFGNQNITIQNSSFGANNGYYSLDLSSSTSTPNQGLHIRNNTFAKGISISAGIQYPGSDLTGNTLGAITCSTFISTGWTVLNNLVGGSGRCG